jgi:hypothetical protein
MRSARRIWRMTSERVSGCLCSGRAPASILGSAGMPCAGVRCSEASVGWLIMFEIHRADATHQVGTLCPCGGLGYVCNECNNRRPPRVTHISRYGASATNQNACDPCASPLRKSRQKSNTPPCMYGPRLTRPKRKITHGITRTPMITLTASVVSSASTACPPGRLISAGSGGSINANSSNGVLQGSTRRCRARALGIITAA